MQSPDIWQKHERPVVAVSIPIAVPIETLAVILMQMAGRREQMWNIWFCSCWLVKK